MQRIRYLLLKLTPEFILVAIRNLLKQIRRKKLAQQEAEGTGLDAEKLLQIFIREGIQKGDAVLAHCSLSKLGFVSGGPKAICDALEATVGPEGTILMPAFPAEGRNLDHVRNHKVFDSRNTPSRMGVISEYFRKLPGTFRSLHPTDSVCARGKDADWFTEGHNKLIRPYAAHSPFRKLCDRNGKILMLGTTLNGACTNLHTLEDAFDNFLYPVYMPEPFETEVIDQQGNTHQVKTFVHNPEWSAKRNADALKPLFNRHGVLKEFKVGDAACMLIHAEAMLDVMKKAYLDKGVTMYTPEGGPLPQQS